MPSHVPLLREVFKPLGELFEHDIPFTRRFLIDSGLTPSDLIEFEVGKGRQVASFKKVSSGASIIALLRTLAFDIETYNPIGISKPGKDPVIMLSYADAGGAKVLSVGKEIKGRKFVETVSDEKHLLKRFSQVLKEKHVDLLSGYNSDGFDLPYLIERAKVLRTGIDFSRGGKMVLRNAGGRSQVKIPGRIHFDAFNVASAMNFIGAFKFSRLTLAQVYKELFGEAGKLEMDKASLFKHWDEGGEKLEYLADYSLADSVSTLRITNFFLPFAEALSKTVGLPLYEISRVSPSVLVENTLMRLAYARGELFPNSPGFGTVQDRLGNPIKGAFVKQPNPGLYENLAVLDFRSLYPSIIISHNVDPSTINCDCCAQGESFVSPTGARFCSKRKGVVPQMLEEVLKERMAIKQKLKGIKDKAGNEFRELDANQWALKILANSTYGYLVFSRSRWYSREAGESITAWARKYIQDTMEQAEKSGFKVLYGDTDSLFIQYEAAGGEEKVREFQKAVNKSLPGAMELELEDFYPRGLFVSKKVGSGTGAKKKYAAINKEGKIKIRGFELVRRDWSKFSRDTQREVLSILLNKGSLEEALALVRDRIELLKSGGVALEQLAITTQLRKKIKDYAITSPELEAAKKAIKKGVKIDEESIISYVITRKGKTTSEKAQILELADGYDADYYVNNQLVPAVLKILEAMGVNEDTITLKGVQKGLGDW
ncbi:DNA polymerase [Candidatus Micrarchaeota archaeon]|nr:DNA polymerase [Candidatus Micrarchaeota archaeon]